MKSNKTTENTLVRKERMPLNRMQNNSEIIIYQTADGQTKIDVRMQDETVWLSLDQLAQLFQRDKSTISRHIKNVFEEGELEV